MGPPKELSEDAKLLLDKLKAEGPRSHRHFMEAFSWDREKYERARNELMELPDIAPYRCRGGGLRIIEQPMTIEFDSQKLRALEKAKSELKEVVAEAETEEEKSEEELYPYVQNWAIKQGHEIVEIVGPLRRRDTWENPDLISVDLSELEWHIGQAVEVTSFEVKLLFDIKAIWQAASYRTFSHYIYLACFESPDDIREKNDGKLYSLCVDLGIGILSMGRRGSGGKGVETKEINSPRRQNPLVQDVDELLSDYSNELKQKGLTNPHKLILKKSLD